MPEVIDFGPFSASNLRDSLLAVLRVVKGDFTADKTDEVDA